MNFRLFRKKIASSNQKRIEYNFNYLDKWEKRVELESHKNYLSGLIFNQIGEYDLAIKFLKRINNSSIHHPMSVIRQSIALKRCNKIRVSRDYLINLINNETFPKDIIMKALIQLGLLETEYNNLNLGRQYLFKALKMKPKSINDLSVIFNNLGESYLIESDLMEKLNEPRYKIRYLLRRALDNFNKALKIKKNTGNPYQIANAVILQ